MADIAANTLIPDPPELVLESHLDTLILDLNRRNQCAVSFSHVFLNIGLHAIQVRRKRIGNRIQFFHSRLCKGLTQSNQFTFNLNAIVSHRKAKKVTWLILLHLINSNVHQKVASNALILAILNGIIHRPLKA